MSCHLFELMRVCCHQPAQDPELLESFCHAANNQNNTAIALVVVVKVVVVVVVVLVVVVVVSVVYDVSGDNQYYGDDQFNG